MKQTQCDRVTDLRQQGVAIRREMKEGKNRYGEKTRYAVYSMEVENA